MEVLLSRWNHLTVNVVYIHFTEKFCYIYCRNVMLKEMYRIHKNLEAACLQIYANFHKIFENIFKSKILWSEQRKLRIYTLQMALTIHINNEKVVKMCKKVLTMLVTQDKYGNKYCKNSHKSPITCTLFLESSICVQI
jgi:hypothetical protein